MQKKVIFVMRYSVLSKKNSTWRIGKNNSYSEYKEILLDQDRLDRRFHLLSRYVIPSIESQTIGLEDITLLILTSKQLPSAAQQDIESLAKSKKWIRIHYMSEDDSLNQEVTKSIESLLGQNTFCYATVRLDDDDLLACGYLAALWKYIRDDFSGFVISFPEGFISKLNEKNQEIEETYSVCVPKTALGLAYITIHDANKVRCAGRYSHIYELGNHTKVNHKAPYLADYSLPAYIRTSYSSQDTGGHNYKKLTQRNLRVSSQQLKMSFSFNESDFSPMHDDF